LPGVASIRSRFIAQNDSFRQQHDFNSAFFAELGENRQSGQSSGPRHALQHYLPRPTISIFIGTQARQFALRGWLGRFHNPAF
jgi:hypothetical protein